MKIGILGTGTVGRALAAKLVSQGHAVKVGTRDPEATLGRTEPDGYGNPPFSEWSGEHPEVSLDTLAEAAAHGEIVINAANGMATLEALELAGAENLGTKVLIDLANPLDFSEGFPPSLSVSNTDSLAEQIQQAFPNVRVVKTLNTMTAPIMVEPDLIGGGDHTVFVSGNDESAKEEVAGLLRSFGWSDIIDLGDISTARGAEMLLPLWLRVLGQTGGPMFQFKIVR